MKILFTLALLACTVSSVSAQSDTTEKSEQAKSSHSAHSTNSAANNEVIESKQSDISFDERMEDYQNAAKIVRSVEKETSSEVMNEKLNSAIEKLPANSFHAHQIQQIITESTSGKSDGASQLGQRLTRIADQLAFKPTLEAESPEGFADPTPVGEIEVKSYPAYRMVQTEVKSESTQDRGASAFFRLFNHIKSNQIEMTSPVEMTYTKNESGMQEKAMAFLYQNQKIGEVAEKDNVKVMDVEPVQVIAMGLRGNVNDSRVKEAYETLKQRAAEIAKDYEMTDEVRVMGYNGPSVPMKDRFHEVQIKLTPTKAHDSK